MNVCLEQMAAINYAATQLEATHVLVTLATHLMQTAVDAMVCIVTVFGYCINIGA